MKNSSQLLFFILLAILCCQCDPNEPIIDQPENNCYSFNSLEAGLTINDGESFRNINITAQKDDWATNGYAKIDTLNYVGEEKNVRLFNINLHLGVDSTVNRISFDFAELGGVNKIIVNGISHNFSDFPELQNTIIDNVGFKVEATQAGNNWMGSFTATGNIESFAFGGQELWIDNLCAKRFKVLLENRRDDPHDNPTHPDGSLTQYDHLREILNERGYEVVEKVEDGIALSEEYINQFDFYIWYLIGISSVSEEEFPVIENYINDGGSVFILTEYDGAWSSIMVNSLLDIYGVDFGDNKVSHPTSNFNDWGTHVIYTEENILDATARSGVENIYVPTSTYFKNLDNEWITVLESDDEANHPNEPVIIRKNYGDGKIMIAGDFNFTMGAPTNIPNMQNDVFIKNLLVLLAKE